MIIVRDVFNVYRDKLAETEPLIRELQAVGAQLGLGPGRVLVDRTESYFERTAGDGRFVIEREFPSIESFSERSRGATKEERWSAAWRACRPVVRSAQREILEYGLTDDVR